MNKSMIGIILIAVLCVLSLGTQSEALCISNKKANLRQGPGTHFEKLWQVFQYMPLKELKKKGKWYRVQDLDGDVYWVHQKLITKKYKCAVIRENETNLRKGPGTDFPQVAWSPVDKYFSMKVIEEKSGWVKIQDSAGDTAWIHKPLIWMN